MKLLPDAVRAKYPVRFFDKGGATETYLDFVRAHEGSVTGLQRSLADVNKRAELGRLSRYLRFAKLQQARMQGQQEHALWPAWVFTPATKTLLSPASTDMLHTLLEATFQEVRHPLYILKGYSR